MAFESARGSFPEDETNPYAAPRSSDRGDEPTEFYRVDSRRVTYREYARIASKPIAFATLVLIKTLQIPARWAFQYAIPKVDRLDIVEPSEVPAHVHRRWKDAFDYCETQGLRLRFFYRLPLIGALRESYAAVLRSDDDLVGASFLYLRIQVRQRLVENVAYTASSRLADGRSAVTAGRRRLLDHPPDIVIQSAGRQSIKTVLERHRQWIASQGWMAVPIPPHLLQESIIERDRSYLDYHIRRGTLIPLTEREYGRMQQDADRPGPAPIPENRLTRGLRRLEAVLGLVLVACILFFWLRRAGSIREEYVRLAVIGAGLGLLLLSSGIRFVVKKLAPGD